jgi:hypothetical protein
MGLLSRLGLHSVAQHGQSSRQNVSPGETLTTSCCSSTIGWEVQLCFSTRGTRIEGQQQALAQAPSPQSAR